MITIFSTCRSFEQFGVIQRNALTSWTLLQPRPQIILLGNEPGTKEICRDLDLEHLRKVKTSDRGTPRVDDMFDLAERFADYDILLFISADILLFQDTLDVCPYLVNAFKTFCAGLRRYEIKTSEPIDFSIDWQKSIQQAAIPGCENAGDYFLFTKGFFQNIPPFLMGRAILDNWLYWYAWQKQGLIDVTKRVMVVHQPHEHPHLNCLGDWRTWFVKHPEFKHNIEMAGETLENIVNQRYNHMKQIKDANFIAV